MLGKGYASKVGKWTSAAGVKEYTWKEQTEESRPKQMRVIATEHNSITLLPPGHVLVMGPIAYMAQPMHSVCLKVLKILTEKVA